MQTMAMLLTAGIVQQQDVVHSNIAPTVYSRLQQDLKREKVVNILSKWKHPIQIHIKNNINKNYNEALLLCIALLLKKSFSSMNVTNCSVIYYN